MIPPISSLVLYDDPSLVSTSIGAKGGAKTLKFDEKQTSTPTEDILHSILPPREWTEDGELWVQYVSSRKSARADVIQLQEDLGDRLSQRRAKETGICPIREETYAQVFDELIRQCTVESPERGLLLLRVRDEMRIIVAEYQILFESSLAYAVRKGLNAEVQRLEAQLLAKKLETDKRDIERQLQELQVRAETITRRESEKWAAMELRQKAELKVLREVSRDCKSKLMDALAPPKWGE